MNINDGRLSLYSTQSWYRLANTIFQDRPGKIQGFPGPKYSFSLKMANFSGHGYGKQ